MTQGQQQQPCDCIACRLNRTQLTAVRIFQKLGLSLPSLEHQLVYAAATIATLLNLPAAELDAHIERAKSSTTLNPFLSLMGGLSRLLSPGDLKHHVFKVAFEIDAAELDARLRRAAQVIHSKPGNN